LIYILLLFLLFGHVIIHDFINRKINIIALISILAIGLHYKSKTLLISWIDLGLNLSFIILNTAALWLYVYLRDHKAPFLDSRIGLGDILFWVSIIPFFEIERFIVIFVLSLVFTLGLHLILLKGNIYGVNKSVPLAGFQSLFILPILVIDFLTLTP
jgi:hypothetical protein